MDCETRKEGINGGKIIETIPFLKEFSKVAIRTVSTLTSHVICEEKDERDSPHCERVFKSLDLYLVAVYQRLKTISKKNVLLERTPNIV